MTQPVAKEKPWTREVALPYFSIMRSVAVVVLLFVSGIAMAQPVIEPEVVSGRLASSLVPPPFAAPAVAMARDRIGVAIAWSMPVDGFERVFVTRLDASAHAIGTTRVVSSPLDVDAFAPSIAAAASGDGFVLTWLESSRMPLRSIARYSRLDASLVQSAPAELTLVSTSPSLVRTGDGGTWLTAGGLLWPLDDNGALSGGFDAGFAASDMTVAATPQLVSARSVVTSTDLACLQPVDCAAAGGSPTPSFCRQNPGCAIPKRATRLNFLALFQSSQTLDLGYVSDNGAAIESNGRDTLVAWLNGDFKRGGEVVAARDALSAPQIIGSFASDFAVSMPDIAADADRYVIVWQNRTSNGDHDIMAAALDREGRVTSIAIPATAADERNPSIITLANGTFLIAYEKIDGDQRFIAGRIISFGARRRAS